MLGYHEHELDDAGRARSSLHAFVPPIAVSESQVLLDQLRRTRLPRQRRPARLIADATDGTGRTVPAMEELGSRAEVPLHAGDTASSFSRHTRCTDDAEKEVYSCPRGLVLRLGQRDAAGARWLERAKAAVCHACAGKTAWTASLVGRLSLHA